jgi:hypothetical protein
MRRSRQVELVPPGGSRGRRRALGVAVLVAAAVLAGPAGAAADPPAREYPVPYTELTLRYDELRVKQGGQRVHAAVERDDGVQGDAVQAAAPPA